MKKFMPLWFWDVIGCEKKLAELEKNGLILKGFSPRSGMFTFEKGSGGEVIYRICRLKNCGGEPPAGIAASGWESVCGSKNYYIVKNRDVATKNIPSYKYWKTANRIVIGVLIVVFCFLAGFIWGFGGALGGRVTESPRFYIAGAAALLVLALLTAAAAVNRKLSKTGVDLELTGFVKTIPAANFTYTKAEEKQMLREKKMIKRSPLGWFYAPDTAEKMVEDMALEGYRFYRFNEMGTVFYFIKSEPHRVKFVVDYQNEASDEYFTQGKDDGWKLEFTSMARSMSFIVWSKEYDGEEVPQFYSDEETKLRRARRMAFTFGIPMIVVAAVYVALGVFAIQRLRGESFLFVVLPLFAVVVVEYAVFGAKTVGFYIRTKAKRDSQ